VLLVNTPMLTMEHALHLGNRPVSHAHFLIKGNIPRRDERRVAQDNLRLPHDVSGGIRRGCHARSLGLKQNVPIIRLDEDVASADIASCVGEGLVASTVTIAPTLGATSEFRGPSSTTALEAAASLAVVMPRDGLPLTPWAALAGKSSSLGPLASPWTLAGSRAPPEESAQLEVDMLQGNKPQSDRLQGQ
jgi:hypothetical protein